MLLRGGVETAVGTEESFCRLVDAEIYHVVAIAVTIPSETLVAALHELLVRPQMHVAYSTDKFGIECVEFAGCTGCR